MNELFAKDFINLQSSISTMPKDKSGYGYKYTDLDTIISIIKPILKANNFGFIQLLKTMYTDTGKTTGIETIILHSSGENISSFVEIPEIQVGKANNAQNVGAAISYFKRYALAAAFGISSDEDIDCSSQVMESRNQTRETAPTVKTSSNKKSETNPKNITTKNEKIEKPAIVSVTTTENAEKNGFSEPSKNKLVLKLYTPEEAQALGEVMNSVYSSGEPIFTGDEKASYKTMLMSGEFENAMTSAQNLRAQRLSNEKATSEMLDNMENEGFF